MLDYNFQEGEEVIDTYGVKGIIVDVCKCEECEKRGFYEPIVKWENREELDWITCSEERQGFPFTHRIGNRIFTPFDRAGAENRLREYKEKIAELQKGIERMNEED